jgi:hypothetical protein
MENIEKSVNEMNYEIAIFCGATLSEVKAKDNTPMGYKVWHSSTKHTYRILNGLLHWEGTLKFNKEWNWMMSAVSYLAEFEGKPLIGTLCKLAGSRGDSIEDVFENFYLYIQNIKNESKI